MEADSTTVEILKYNLKDNNFPFLVRPLNLQCFSDLISKEDNVNKAVHLVQALQKIGLIPTEVNCPKGAPECRMRYKPARVVDRVKWVCDSCNANISIRHGTFFLRMPCTLLQVMQIILAWCEDVDSEAVAQYFDVKPKIVLTIYDKLDAIIIEEQRKWLLGGENKVVLTEMYPDCLNRLSPDTTEQPHSHKVLMIADTSRIPTRYCLHVIKKTANTMFENEISEVISQKTLPNSTIVMGNYVPMIESATSLQSLLQHCDNDMQHFLSMGIWRQAVTLCAASRDLCASAPLLPVICAPALQQYLDAALYRISHGDGFYAHVLSLIARKVAE